jgi:hypothetical protein
MAQLFTPHERALTLLFGELTQTAAALIDLPPGTPGSLAERRNAAGARFWVRRYIDAAGKRREQYIGLAGDPQTDVRLAELSEQIAAINGAIRSVRLLAGAGWAVVDKKAYFTLASLHRHGLFAAGAFLIGSHAYGVLLNHLGVRAVAWATEDVDIARGGQLALPQVRGFMDMLLDSGLEFVAVPALDRKQASTSFKERGVSRFHVDLLVPSADDSYPVVPIPELKAHATGLPYLAYLLGEWVAAPVLSAHGVALVRVPVAARFAVHKVLVSQLRSSASSKSDKDLAQAAVLLEALSERQPGAIEDALSALPASGRKYVKRGIRALKRHLPAAAQGAWLELEQAGR